MSEERPRSRGRAADSWALGTPVRLAVVEEVADAVDGVLEERCGEENDDAFRGRNAGNRVERGDEAGRLGDVGENEK